MSIPSISIQNKNGVSILIDEEDLGLLTQRRDGRWCFSVSKYGYALVHRKSLEGVGYVVAFHRLIMDASVGLEVNYINGNKLDNRKKNLRLCTKSQNTMNAPGRGVSQFKGVYQKRDKWLAAIKDNGKQTHIGTFTTELEAAKAYDAAARLQNCEFRTLNFPNEVPND